MSAMWRPSVPVSVVWPAILCLFCFFFFNDTATTEIYTLSLHDALPIFHRGRAGTARRRVPPLRRRAGRSEEHTSELQSPDDLVCRLLLQKKKHTEPLARRRKLPKRRRAPKPQTEF